MSMKAIRQRIITDLKAAEGLTGAGQVMSGKFSKPPGTVLPFVSVYTAEVVEEPDATLRRFRQGGVWMVTGWAKPDARTPEAVQDAAEDLADLIRSTLRADSKLGDLVDGFTSSAIPFEPADQRQGQMYGICMVVVKAWWRESR